MAKIYVKEISTGEVVKEIEVGNPSERRAERIMRGMLINMNTDKYYVDDSELE